MIIVDFFSHIFIITDYPAKTFGGHHDYNNFMSLCLVVGGTRHRHVWLGSTLFLQARALRAVRVFAHILLNWTLQKRQISSTR